MYLHCDYYRERDFSFSDKRKFCDNMRRQYSNTHCQRSSFIFMDAIWRNHGQRQHCECITGKHDCLYGNWWRRNLHQLHYVNRNCKSSPSR